VQSPSPWASARTASFAEMEQEAPELAAKARERFGATGLSLVATLRSDGWPRISPVEPLLLDGQLYLGMMLRSAKSLDLGRDPRCLVHSTVADKEATEGEVKLYAVARRVTDGDEIERYCVALEEAIGWRPKGPDDFDLWVADLVSAVHQYFTPEESSHTAAIWRPGEDIRSITKKAPT
jgi:Pyridoxamine 5'-phosphate oxidase